MASAQSIPMIIPDIGKMLRALDKLSEKFKTQESYQLTLIQEFRQSEREYERHKLYGTPTKPDGFRGLPLESSSWGKMDVPEKSLSSSDIPPPDAAILLAAQQSRSDALMALDTLESCKEILRSWPTQIPTVVGLRELIDEVKSQVALLESEPNGRNVEYLETYLLQLDGFLYGIGLLSKP